MQHHQLGLIVASSAVAVALLVVDGVPFLEMLPFLLVLGGPVVGVVVLWACGVLRWDGPDAGAQRAPRALTPVRPIRSRPPTRHADPPERRAA